MFRLIQYFIPLITTLLALSAQAAAPLTDIHRQSTYYAEITRIIEEVRPEPKLRILDSFLNSAPSFSKTSSLQERIRRVSDYIFKDLKITPDTSFLSRSAKDNILPDSVLNTKAGHCLGLSILYLLIAEKNKQLAYLVRAPDHVFVRYCDAELCLNIETLKKGAIVPDSFFIKNLLIPKQTIGRNYLINLSSPQELGASIYLGLGFIADKAGQSDLGLTFYKKSGDLSKNFAEPHSNLASLLFAKGAFDSAKIELEKALLINPDHYATLMNWGAYLQSKKDLANALVYYDRAIKSNPVSYQAYYRRGNLLSILNRTKEAMLDFDRVLIIQPKFCDVIKMRNELAKRSGQKIKPELILFAEELNRSHQCLYIAN